MSNSQDFNHEIPKEAKQILDRVDRDSTPLFASAFSRTANQIHRHMLGKDKNQNDKLEVYGTITARILSFIAFLLLSVYLVFSYILYT